MRDHKGSLSGVARWIGGWLHTAVMVCSSCIYTAIKTHSYISFRITVWHFKTLSTYGIAQNIFFSFYVLLFVFLNL